MNKTKFHETTATRPPPASTNVLKAVIVSLVVSALVTLYVSSTAFVEQASRRGEDTGRVEAFLRAAEITEDFWPHLLKGWIFLAGIALLSCLALLAWMTLAARHRGWRQP